MFNTPIKHIRLTSMEDVKKFSYKTNIYSEYAHTMTFNNGQIAFSDVDGLVYVTPYRPEILEILHKAGYSEKHSLYVTFSNNEKESAEYQWLIKIAEEENWAKTYEDAYKVASKNGIQPVHMNGNYQINEITYCDYIDTKTNLHYYPLTAMFLFNETNKNVGTYIFVDEKTLMICEEYGRTFLFKAKTVVNDFVNALIDAGYTRTIHPENYIYKEEEPPKKNNKWNPFLKKNRS